MMLLVGAVLDELDQVLAQLGELGDPAVDRVHLLLRGLTDLGPMTPKAQVQQLGDLL